jgi:uncharacterized protein YlbG (UPF0298 family)
MLLKIISVLVFFVADPKKQISKFGSITFDSKGVAFVFLNPVRSIKHWAY